MTTATTTADTDAPLGRPVRLLPVTGRRDRPEPPEPSPAPGVGPEGGHDRTRPAHCRFAMHVED
ncbi:hypothetical protein ACFYUY_10595 [Kitasatospora sp. NPDC004745]|uniref:hypothetical protein n=1 Tax=unclassified Kitasatospora TaxID=2633591 RepID=UPI00340CAFA8